MTERLPFGLVRLFLAELRAEGLKLPADLDADGFRGAVRDAMNRALDAWFADPVVERDPDDPNRVIITFPPWFVEEHGPALRELVRLNRGEGPD